MRQRGKHVIIHLSNACPKAERKWQPQVLKSGDNVWQQVIFDHRDLVFELELALLEPRNLQLIDESALLPSFGQCRYRRIKVAMLGPQ